MNKDADYKSRKEQVEKGMIPSMLREINKHPSRQRSIMRKWFRSAVMIGACEERDRILQFESMNSRLRELIIEPSILSVLGYE